MQPMLVVVIYNEFINETLGLVNDLDEDIIL